MPTPENLTLQVSVNSGPQQTGAITVNNGDTLDLSPQNPSGITSLRYEIYGYPPGFTVPSGWSTDTDGITFYVITNGSAAPQITYPVSASIWGKLMFRATANSGLRNSEPAADLIDEDTAVQVLGPNGEEDIGYLEAGQFGGVMQWVRPLQNTIRVLSLLIGGGITPPATPAEDGGLAVASAGDLNYLLGAAVGDLAVWDGSAWVSSITDGVNPLIEAGNELLFDSSAQYIYGADASGLHFAAPWATGKGFAWELGSPDATLTFSQDVGLFLEYSTASSADGVGVQFQGQAGGTGGDGGPVNFYTGTSNNETGTWAAGLDFEASGGQYNGGTPIGASLAVSAGSVFGTGDATAGGYSFTTGAIADPTGTKVAGNFLVDVLNANAGTLGVFRVQFDSDPTVSLSVSETALTWGAGVVGPTITQTGKSVASPSATETLYILGQPNTGTGHGGDVVIKGGTTAGTIVGDVILDSAGDAIDDSGTIRGLVKIRSNGNDLVEFSGYSGGFNQRARFADGVYLDFHDHVDVAQFDQVLLTTRYNGSNALWLSPPAASGTSNTRNVAFFGPNYGNAIAFASMQRGIFLGNVQNAPTADPSSGGLFIWGDSSTTLNLRGAGSEKINFVNALALQVGGSDVVTATSTLVTVGAGALNIGGTNAAAGALRTINGTAGGWYSRNNADTQSVAVAFVGADDRVYIGDTTNSGGITLQGSTSHKLSVGGTIVGSWDAGGLSVVGSLSLDFSSSEVDVRRQNTTIYGSATGNVATIPQGKITVGGTPADLTSLSGVGLTNNTGIYARNLANTGNVRIAFVSTGDDIAIGDSVSGSDLYLDGNAQILAKVGGSAIGTWDSGGLTLATGKRLDVTDSIALGGGAAATLGTIGGSGPTAAAQLEWIEIEKGGAKRWIPAWS